MVMSVCRSSVVARPVQGRRASDSNNQWHSCRLIESGDAPPELGAQTMPNFARELGEYMILLRPW